MHETIINRLIERRLQFVNNKTGLESWRTVIAFLLNKLKQGDYRVLGTEVRDVLRGNRGYRYYLRSLVNLRVLHFEGFQYPHTKEYIIIATSDELQEALQFLIDELEQMQ